MLIGEFCFLMCRDTAEMTSPTSAKQVRFGLQVAAQPCILFVRADLSMKCGLLHAAKRMPVKRVYTPGLLMELSRQDQEAGDELRDLLEKKRLIVTKVRCPFQRVRLPWVNLWND